MPGGGMKDWFPLVNAVKLSLLKQSLLDFTVSL